MNCQCKKSIPRKTTGIRMTYLRRGTLPVVIVCRACGRHCSENPKKAIKMKMLIAGTICMMISAYCYGADFGDVLMAVVLPGAS